MSNKDVLAAYASLRRELTLLSTLMLKEIDMGRSQTLILRFLAERPATMGELTNEIQSDPAATTRTVSSLEKAGHVRRSGDKADGRRTLISLTAKGTRMAAAAIRLRNELEAKVEKVLSEEECVRLTSLLAKAARKLQEERERSL